MNMEKEQDPRRISNVPFKKLVGDSWTAPETICGFFFLSTYPLKYNLGGEVCLYHNDMTRKLSVLKTKDT